MDPVEHDCPDSMGMCPECLDVCLKMGDEPEKENADGWVWRVYCPACNFEAEWLESKLPEDGSAIIPPYEP